VKKFQGGVKQGERGVKRFQVGEKEDQDSRHEARAYLALMADLSSVTR